MTDSSIHDYLKPGCHAHLVGIGGVSMAPLAEVLHGAGMTITGSDMRESATVEHLRSLGISVAIGQRADGAVIFVCIDGRQPSSRGGEYADVIDILVEYGAINACNMDGGSSTVMMYRDTYGLYGEAEQVQMIFPAPSPLRRSQKHVHLQAISWQLTTDCAAVLSSLTVPRSRRKNIFPC